MTSYHMGAGASRNSVFGLEPLVRVRESIDLDPHVDRNSHSSCDSWQWMRLFMKSVATQSGHTCICIVQDWPWPWCVCVCVCVCVRARARTHAHTKVLMPVMMASLLQWCRNKICRGLNQQMHNEKSLLLNRHSRWLWILQTTFFFFRVVLL